MTVHRGRGLWAAAALACAALVPVPPTRGDNVRLKNGLVFQGNVNRDKTIVLVYSGDLKRLVFRDSQIARIESSPTPANTFERFRVDQPLQVHGGLMPTFATGVAATPWDKDGRRKFTYYGQGPKAIKPSQVTMIQAIIELGPLVTRFRGIDGFWQGQVLTSQVPREVVLELLKLIDRNDEELRKKVCLFLIQAEWYREAMAELDAFERDFPNSEWRENVRNARATIRDLQARLVLDAIKGQFRAQQPQGAVAQLRKFPTAGVTPGVLSEVRTLLRDAEKQAAADTALADELRKLADRSPAGSPVFSKAPLVEILQTLAEAPDAVRSRLDAFQKARDDRDKTSEARLALAWSGWVVGSDAAVTSMAAAEGLWQARNLVREYLQARSPDVRAALLEQIEGVSLEGTPIDAATLTRIIGLMPPPARAERVTPGQPMTLRVRDDDNIEPTEYQVLLPPEYHPFRSYPAVLALHSGRGPRSALEFWGREAQRRGFIVVAPEYTLPGQSAGYRFSADEHGAVVLALRDALKRFAIDSDRVFLAGQLTGADMAWDFGLAHPDLFAGVATVGGGPTKYVYAYKAQTRYVPFYIVAGDLFPFNDDIFFPFVKGLIVKPYDVLYVEYLKRGQEDLPEEVPGIFDWMERHRPDGSPVRREPYLKEFTVTTGRTCDDRFFGVVVKEFARRLVAPEAVDPLGRNLSLATIQQKTSSLSNLINLVKVDGIRRLDVWVSPKLIDFGRKMEVRVNGRPYLKGLVKPDLAALLEDLRFRGDRRQVYWLKVPVSLGAPPVRDRRSGQTRAPGGRRGVPYDPTTDPLDRRGL